jgi:hypothetical protein
MCGGGNAPTPPLWLCAIGLLNRLEVVVETMRQALNTLAVVAPDWIRAHVPADGVLRSDHRAEDYRLPQADQERTALAEGVGQDGFQVLAWIRENPTDQWLLNVPAMRDTSLRSGRSSMSAPLQSLRWRQKPDSPVPTQHICSPYDPEARWATKGTRTWVGYKVALPRDW